MATYVRGNAVENATSYELFENIDGTYNSLATAEEINFEVSALGLAAGAHVLAVKAHADGYASSEYSDPVTYTAAAETVDITSEFSWNSNGVIKYASGEVTTGSTVMKYSDFVDISGAVLLSMAFMTWTSSTGKITSYGMAFYDSEQTYISGYGFPLGSSGNSNGESYMLELEVPENAVFVRTTYIMAEETYGAFSASIAR